MIEIKAIKEKEAELIALCEKYPTKIPAPEVAKFLGCNYDGLCAGIEKGTIPFAFSYRKDRKVVDGKNIMYIDGRLETVVPTMKFLNWIYG